MPVITAQCRLLSGAGTSVEVLLSKCGTAFFPRLDLELKLIKDAGVVKLFAAYSLIGRIQMASKTFQKR